MSIGRTVTMVGPLTKRQGFFGSKFIDNVAAGEKKHCIGVLG